MHKVVRSFLLFPALLAAFLAFSHAGDEKPPQRYEPKVAPASKEKLAAMKRLRLPKGLAVDLYAAEPLLANPVCFCFDENGRCYVAETFRLHAGVTDNRGHMNWLDDDLAARSVADRLALYRKYLKDRVKDYEKEHDCVRLLLDTDGDGKPDKAVVFADGFHRAEDGIGAGLPARARSTTPAFPTCGGFRIPTATGKWTSGSRSRPGMASTFRSSATTCTACAWALTASFTSPSATAASTSGRKRASDCSTPTPELCCAATSTAQTWRWSQPGCATRRSWPSTTSGTSLRSITTPTPATRRGSSRSSRAAIAAGISAISTAAGCTMSDRGWAIADRGTTRSSGI